MTDNTGKIMNAIYKSNFEFLIWDAIDRQDVWNLNLEGFGLKMKLSDCQSWHLEWESGLRLNSLFEERQKQRGVKKKEIIWL